MSNPKFSILMPVVRCKFFKEAFESAQSQIFQDYEIIVLDNKADAEVSWVLDSKDVRVKYFANETRLPPIENWNKGLSLCSGDYVVVLSDDDLLEKSFLDEVERFLHSEGYHELEIVRVLRRNIDENGKAIDFSAPGRTIERYAEFLYNNYRFSRYNVLSDIIIKREPLIETGGFDQNELGWASDHIVAFKMAARHNKIGNLNKILMSYRVHAGNLTNSYSAEKFKAKLKGDHLVFKLNERLLQNFQNDEYYHTAKIVNSLRFQKCQDAHYGAALVQGGLLALIRLNGANSGSEASKRRSIIWGLLYWIKSFKGN